MAGALHIRPYGAGDADWLTAHAQNAGGTRVVSRGVLHDLTTLPGFIAEREGKRCGFAFFRVDGDACELVAIEASEQWTGVGTQLVAAVEQAARSAGCGRLWLITTNDNLDAMRFYQRRGFQLETVHRGAVDDARRIKPSIPHVGNYGIAIRDEVELAKRVS